MDNYKELEDLTPTEEVEEQEELQDVPDDGDYNEGLYELYLEAQERAIWGY